MMPASPRPWTIQVVRQPLTENVYYVRINDAHGNKVAALSTNESVGGRGLEQALADAQLIVALANSPAAAQFETDARHAAPAEIPEGERAPTAAMGRLL